MIHIILIVCNKLRVCVEICIERNIVTPEKGEACFIFSQIRHTSLPCHRANLQGWSHHKAWTKCSTFIFIVVLLPKPYHCVFLYSSYPNTYAPNFVQLGALICIAIDGDGNPRFTNKLVLLCCRCSAAVCTSGRHITVRCEAKAN